MGVVFIATVLWAPHGIVGLFARGRRAWTERRSANAAAPVPRAGQREP